MLDNASAALKVTLEINQETNLDELMAHLCMMQGSIPAQNGAKDGYLPDFSIHEGELDPA